MKLILEIASGLITGLSLILLLFSAQYAIYALLLALYLYTLAKEM